MTLLLLSESRVGNLAGTEVKEAARLSPTMSNGLRALCRASEKGLSCPARQIMPGRAAYSDGTGTVFGLGSVPPTNRSTVARRLCPRNENRARNSGEFGVVQN